MIFIDNFLSLPVGSLKVVDLKARRLAKVILHAQETLDALSLIEYYGIL